MMMRWWWCSKHHIAVPVTDECPICEREKMNPSRREQ
jgi:hypothetical protein